MKAFSDLEQSKKLAEILPLESADMYWQSNLNSSDRQYLLDMGEEEYFDIEMNFEHCSIGDYDIPAWSLAALLEEIPEIINFDDDKSNYALEILKEGDLYYLSYGNPLDGDKLNIEPQENFIDACVAMVKKLHGLNLL